MLQFGVIGVGGKDKLAAEGLQYIPVRGVVVVFGHTIKMLTYSDSLIIYDIKTRLYDKIKERYFLLTFKPKPPSHSRTEALHRAHNRRAHAPSMPRPRHGYNAAHLRCCCAANQRASWLQNRFNVSDRCQTGWDRLRLPMFRILKS